MRRGLLLALGIVALWGAALCFPEIGTCPHGNVAGEINWFGADAVVMWGWLGALTGELAWYANIPLILAVIALLDNRRPSRIGAVVALLLAVSMFVPTNLWHHEGYGEPICAYGIGAWLWLLCFPLVMLAAFVPGFGRASRRVTAECWDHLAIQEAANLARAIGPVWSDPECDEGLKRAVQHLEMVAVAEFASNIRHLVLAEKELAEAEIRLGRQPVERPAGFARLMEGLKEAVEANEPLCRVNCQRCHASVVMAAAYLGECRGKTVEAEIWGKPKD
jgi:hypothetical protein